MMGEMSQSLRERFEALKDFMDQCAKGPVCVAFSGGVDSSLLLKMACESAEKFHNPVYAVTFWTMLHPACDLEIVGRVAAEVGADHHVIEVNELELEALRNNPPERCYLCKRHLFQTLLKFADERGAQCAIDGTNEDDLHVYRPGLKALKELGIISPLARFHITKQEVKELASGYGLSTSGRPSTPCMATRLPYGEPLDYALLRRIEEGETGLKAIFTGNIRLRVHWDTARIEVDPDQMETAVKRREEICAMLKGLGFRYITLDLAGFRSGSMDSALENAGGRYCL